MSLCCENCFFDPFLKNHIRAKNIKGDCDYCDSKNVHCINPEDLEYLLKPLMNLYSPVEDFMPMEMLKDHEGDLISDKLENDWDLFDQVPEDKREDLLKSVFETESLRYGLPRIFDSYVDIEDDFYGIRDDTAKKMSTEWNQFSKEVKEQNRFFPSNRIDLDNLQSMLQLFDNKQISGNTFFRARISHDKKRLTPGKMGKPPKDRTKNGRANPNGISYLYLASDIDTAFWEVRPSIHDYVTIGTFKLLEDVSIIDLRFVSPFHFVLAEEFESAVKQLDYFSELSSDLSKPIDSQLSDLDYLPTQYLCEFIKNCSWEGVSYKSSFTPGYNLALFSDKKVACRKTRMYKVNQDSLRLVEVPK